MKKILLLAMLVCVFMVARAQKIQFGNPTNKWCFIDSTIGCCIPYPLVYTKAYYDSSVTGYSYGGHTYQYLVNTVSSSFVRQDGNKVYLLYNGDSVERLAYDFDMKLSDTLRNNYPEDRYVAWVTHIDSTILAGVWYKVWHFEGVDTVTFFTDSVRSFSYNVIEGIGCTNGLLYPAMPYSLSAFSQQLLCFDNDSHITSGLSTPVTAYGWDYTSSYDNDSSCREYYADHNRVPEIHDATSVTAITLNNESAIVFPNPLTAESKIVLPYKMEHAHVAIIDLSGQAITTLILSNISAINVGQLSNTSGVYFYHVIDDLNGKVFTGKIIYQ